MFRLSAFSAVAAALVASSASAQIVICVVTEGTPPTFETMNVTETEYTKYDQISWEGPCTEYLGQLCDDGDFCTIDYDEDAMVCLPFPRSSMVGCAKA